MAKEPKTKEEVNTVTESVVPDKGPASLASPPDVVPVAVASVKVAGPPVMRAKLTRANHFYWRRLRSMLKSMGKLP